MTLLELRQYIDRLIEATSEDATVEVNKHRHLVIDTADQSQFGVFTFTGDTQATPDQLASQLIARKRVVNG